jgi:hypothetical protein
MKFCPKCHLNKEFSEFYTRGRGGFSSDCKSCIKNKQTKYYAKTGYKSTEEQNTRRRQIEQFKLKTDNSFKIKKYLRTRIRAALKKNWKKGSAVTDLGCSIEKFKLWIEMHWQNGMNWNNYSLHGWHIDHIKPLSSFNLTQLDEFRKAVHFTNLQPLWAEDNYKKK